MGKRRILWIDDEINSFGSLVKILEEDYEVATAASGADGLEQFDSATFDLVILDEQMPGMDGIAVLRELKERKQSIPVIMLTQSEDNKMAKTAVGLGIDEFKSKPAKAIELMTSIQRLLDQKAMMTDQMRQACNSLYMKVSSGIADCRTFADWAELYKQIVEKEVAAEEMSASDIAELYAQIREEANHTFSKFVKDNYESWFSGKPSDTKPAIFSHQILTQVVKPHLAAGEKIALVVIDNFRLDQWVLFSKLLEEEYNIDTNLYCSILPTATQFSRNAIFAGKLPQLIKKETPQFWVDNSDNEEKLNGYERDLLSFYFARQWPNKKCSYYKVGLGEESGENYIKKFGGYKDNDLNAVVFSFVDALSHAAASNSVNRKLLSTDASYRSVTLSWLKHDVIKPIFDIFAANGYKIILTTDHGTIKASKPVDVTGTKDINSNMRYKVDKNIVIKDKAALKKVLDISKPGNIGLPTQNPSDRFIFATNDDFFVYPNDRNDFVSKFQGSFQHGGISLEEMILPLVTITKK